MRVFASALPAPAPPSTAPAHSAEDLTACCPPIIACPIDIEDVLVAHLRSRRLSRISARIRPGDALRERASQRPSGRRDRQSPRVSSKPRIGGIIYTETARKVAYFVELAERQGTPIIYFQDVSGFMVGLEAESEGIIRAGAEMVETMSCATVPRIVLTINHASGAGYYAMAGQGFDPNFTFSWPTARIGVMEGDSAVQALFSVELEKLKKSGSAHARRSAESIERTRADYERWLDAKYAAARGHATRSSIHSKPAKC